MINMEAIPKFDIKSVIKSDIKFDTYQHKTDYMDRALGIRFFFIHTVVPQPTLSLCSPKR